LRKLGTEYESRCTQFERLDRKPSEAVKKSIVDAPYWSFACFKVGKKAGEAEAKYSNIGVIEE
jgi:hypothetical protein